ncbi:hypothetical protein CB0940_05766 [Cercospora beticola]|uniref:Uncharacterized protein n=1 Tax=Cercospora beticola TaxID=122368 RepID=A0A2G5HZE3_CERBT|nr:hypothetical protein CB0940_05766 [Cercospora beticola]PIA97914.1 hypothetical protein CB0940_05766 [Cercospora beticola]
MANEPDAPPFERVLTLATRKYEGASLTNNRLKSLLLAIGKQQETALKCFVASSSESTTTTHSSFISRRLSDPAFGTSSNIVTFERNEGSQPEHTPLLTQAPTCLSGLAQKSIEKLEKIQVKDHEQSPAAEKKIAFVTDKPSTEPKLPKELSSMRFTPSTAVKTAPQGRVIKPTDWDDQQSSDQYEPRTSSSKPNRKHQFEDASTKKQTKPAQSVSRPESSVEILAAEINALSTDSDDEQDKTKVQVKDTQPRPKYGYGRVRQMFPIDEEELAALAKENASKSSSMPIAAVVSPAVAPESNSPSSKD